MLVDSNLIIYAARPEYEALRQFLAVQATAISVVTYIEVLGYHQLAEAERQTLIRLFELLEVLPLSDAVAQRAVGLRQRRKMTLGDSVIAATALVHGLMLATHNTDDFRWIKELTVVDPLAETSSG